MTSTHSTIGSVPESFVEKVRAEIEKAANPQKSIFRNLGVLLLTLFLFVSLGLFSLSLSGLIVLVVVLFVHEAGHLIGMKLLGYRDVQMFFIPFLGAAVSGTESNPSSNRKAIVALLGPIPGVLIGIICGILYLKTKQDIFAVSASTFLFINGLNLLPFHPLDGGRFFDYLLFSRNPKIEITFKVITCILLGYLAYLLKAPIIGLFTVFVFLSLKATFLSSTTAHHLKKNINLEELSQKDMPDPHFQNVISQLRKKLTFRNDNARFIAKYIQDIWNRVRNKPATTGATLGLVSIYLPFLIIGVFSPFIFATAQMVKDTKTEIVDKVGENGEYIQAEIRYYRDKKIAEIHISKDGLYNGLQTEWHLQNGFKSKEGTWKDGFWHGEWKSWDQEGKLESIVEYENGKAVRYVSMKSGQPVEIPKEQWPYALRNVSNSVPQGPRKQ
jgi:Zn-dependent protease